MKKYQAVFSISLANIFQYRTNFFLDRVGSLISLLTVYFLWQAVFISGDSMFGYSRSQMLTYVIISHLARSVVLQTMSSNIAGEIAAGGKFFSYLLRPISYVKYWLAVDLGYKLVSTIFALLEVIIFVKLFNIALSFPLVWSTWIMALGVFFLAVMLNFLLGLAVSLAAFWTQEVWAPRFLFEVILGFSSGSFFPLDVLPVTFQHLLSLTPFPYLVFFPANVLLGRISPVEILSSILVVAIYLTAIAAVSYLLWQKGLRLYEGGSI